MEEAALRAHQSSFLRLERKLFVLRPVCLLTKHGYLCFSLPLKIDITVHMDVELNPGPASSSLRSKRKWPYRECRSGRTVKVRKATKVLIFNPPWHLLVTNLHFTQDVMTTILFVFRWYKIGHAEVHHEVSVFGMLAHWKPKYRCYVILCHLVVLTSYLWMNCGLPRTIALPLPTSLIYLKITLFITCQDPPAPQGFSPCDSISTSTAQEKWLYSRKFFLRILCVLRGVNCYILSTLFGCRYNGNRHPIAYASRTLNEHDNRYGQIYTKRLWRLCLAQIGSTCTFTAVILRSSRIISR